MTSKDAHASLSLLKYECYGFIDSSSPRSGESYGCFTAYGSKTAVSNNSENYENEGRTIQKGTIIRTNQ